MTGLDVAPGLTLPVDAVTETFALLAVRRAGKSNAAVVMAEEMYDNGLPWVAIDPKGDWWGVRAAGDGKAPGLSVLVFGGLNGDVPLEPTAGKLVADLIVTQRLTCVLDVSEMSKADQRRFLTAFALQLYQQNREPLHVFCEEADEYIPQRVTGADAALVGAFEKLIKRGGFRGIGVTLITQRSASLNKDVLTQVGTLIPMRTPSPQDRKAILAWVDTHDSGRDVVDDLPKLENGEAYVFSPQWLDTLQKIRFRRRRTFDSGATPKAGQKVRPPATLADVDIASIQEAMAETIEKAAADDPKQLRAEIARLTRELQQTANAPAAVEKVEVSVLTDDDRKVLTYVLGHLDGLKFLATPLHDLKARAAAADERSQTFTPPTTATRARMTEQTKKVTKSANPGAGTGAGSTSMSKAERLIIATLAQYGERSQKQIALLTGYSAKGGGFRNGLGALRSAGLIVGSGDSISLTEDGQVAAADVPDLPQGPELIDHWRSTVGGKAERLIFDALLDAYPAEIDQDTLAARTDYAPGGGGFRNAIGKLRTLGVLVGGKDGMTLATEIGEAR